MSRPSKNNVGASRHGKLTEFRMWAPFAQSVSITGSVTAENPKPMKRDDEGYWVARLKNVEPGHNYVYVINTGEQTLYKPDPRARLLTSSDNGASVVIDPEFDWGNGVFSPIPPEKQIIYELHVGTFNRPDAATTGTFSDAIEKLDYLVSLGINTIELMPVTTMAHSYGWGYAPSHIFSVENAYGGRHGLLSFVKACHDRGIGVVLDVVYNHFSSDTSLWQFDGWSENGRGGIYFYNDVRGDTPWGGRPDYGRPEVQQFITDNVAMWLTEYRLDGLRVDSTIFMRNTEGQDNDPDHDIGDAWNLLGKLNTMAHNIKPEALMIAEDCANNAYITKTSQDGGCAFDAQWELGFPHALRDALGIKQPGQQTLTGLRYELEKQYNGNAFEKIIFSDSHDTAANGSVRLNQAAGNNNAADLFARERTLLAEAITLTSPGIPMLLQGQEFMQQGAFNDWRELEWKKAEKYSGIVLAHRHLIDLRLNRYGNTAGLLGQSTTIFHQDETNAVIAYHRWNRGGAGDDTIVIANFSNTPYDSYEMQFPIPGKWAVRFNSSWKGYSPDFHEKTVDHIQTDKRGRASVPLAAYVALVFSQEHS